MLDVGRVVDFVNEYADHPRATAAEQEMPYPDAAGLLAWPAQLPTPPAGDLVPAANQIFQVFSSAPDGRALDELNQLLRSAGLTPLATERGLRWTVGTRRELLPAGRRRFCSSICLNRHKVGAFRQRNR